MLLKKVWCRFHRLEKRLKKLNRLSIRDAIRADAPNEKPDLLIIGMGSTGGTIDAAAILATLEDFGFDGPVALDPEAKWIFIVDQFNTHQSECMVRFVAEQCGLATELGGKGNAGVLAFMATRKAFLPEPSHRIRFVYPLKHTSWLNQVEIWFGILALAHTLLILNGWARWDLQRFLGYEFIPELGRLVRLEPGFGLANLMGVVSGVIALALLATSTDWAVRKLGTGTWKYLHQGVYIIFWLVVLHTSYFLFIHYTEHFHRAPPPPDWFRYPFVALTLAVVTLQAGAFFRTVQMRVHRAVPGQTRPPAAPTVRRGRRYQRARQS
jgi:methionine sulfoxide reductase heme-binding subunit